MSDLGARRHLLLVSYYFAPTASVGSVRAGGLAKYLPRHGWRVTIVTPRRPGRSLPGLSICETGDADLTARLKTRLGLSSDAALKDALAASTQGTWSVRARAHAIDFVKALVAVPDNQRGWAKLAVEAGLGVFGHDPFDALMTTSPPVSAHLAGRRLARLCNRPWVADLRDLWSSDRNSTAPEWRRAIDRQIERRVLSAASALVTVSAPLARELRDLHPRSSLHSILNGFDPEKRHLARGLTPDFTLTHTGTFYQGRRDPTLLFEALSRLLESGALPRDRTRVRFFARHEPWVSALADHHRLGDIVSVLPWGSWDDALRAQQESQALLLFSWGGDREIGVYTGKIFEYLAARRPVLLICGPKGVLTDLLDETGAGTHLTRKEEIEAWLLRAFEEFRSSGAVSYHGDERRIEKYSHIRMAEEFAEVLDKVVATRSGPNAEHGRDVHG